MRTFRVSSISNSGISAPVRMKLVTYIITWLLEIRPYKILRLAAGRHYIAIHTQHASGLQLNFSLINKAPWCAACCSIS